MKEKVSTAIIESMSDALLVLNFRGYVIRANPAALALFGLEPRDVLTLPYMEVFMDRPENDAFNDIIVDGIQNRATRLYREVPFRTRDGTRIDLAVTTSFLKSEAREDGAAGIVLVVKDITEAKALDRARNRVLDHLSHELRTPLSIVMASIARLETPEKQAVVQRIRRNLGRIEAIQMEVDEIVKRSNIREYPRFSAWAIQMLDLVDTAAGEDRAHRKAMNALRARMKDLFRIDVPEGTPENPWDVIPEVVVTTRALAAHRRVGIRAVAGERVEIAIDGDLLRKCAMAFLKNAVENTPDGGEVTAHLRNREGSVEFAIRDTGVGITAESQKQIFGGFYHAKDTDLYATKRPFDFDAGGKGLDLLRLRVYSESYGFRLTCESRRCRFIPSEKDTCAGDVSQCPHIQDTSQCALSGGSTFTAVFPPVG